MVGGDKLKRE